MKFLPSPAFVPIHPKVSLAFTLATLLAGGALPLCAQQPNGTGDSTVTGTLNVGGNVNVSGNLFNFGSQTGNATLPGLIWEYKEASAPPYAATLTLEATRYPATWLWKAKTTSSSSAASANLMSLDNASVLKIYGNGNNSVYYGSPAGIVLDPNGISSFYNGMTVYGGTILYGGAKILSPTSYSGSDAVLTIGAADARYDTRYLLRNWGTTALAIGAGATAPGTNAMAVGGGAQASGGIATAVGYGASAGGDHSSAFGFNAKAISVQATALGAYTVVDNDFSAALGYGSHAGGYSSLSLGINSAAQGQNSVTLGAFSSATQYASTALGAGSQATGLEATALGNASQASGDYSVSVGYLSKATFPGAAALGAYSLATNQAASALSHGAQASGVGSTAVSYASKASGHYSTSIGYTEAGSVFQTVVGAFNEVTGDQAQWIGTDPIFTVGNGQSTTNRSNAFVVSKNGNAKVKNQLEVKTLKVTDGMLVLPQGGLTMGTFTNGPQPQ